jgi:tetratricopeptide (TPR) repeat protein
VDEAIAWFRRAIHLDPKLAPAHLSLGNALAGQGQLDEAIASFRKAIELNPKYALAHLNLGSVLGGQGQLDEAIASLRKAIELNPKLPKAHVRLGLALLSKGRPAEARDATARALELLHPKDPGWAFTSRQLQACERFTRLEERLPRLLEGEDKPASAREGLEVAALCRWKGRYAAAARFFADAFAADPGLAADLPALHRYDAACCAALAAAGKDKDAGLDARQKARLRGQALAWLKADLALWAQEVQGGAAERQQAARRQLAHWKGDPDLTSVRDPAALDRLPEEERAAWRKLWAAVEDFYNRLAGVDSLPSP